MKPFVSSFAFAILAVLVVGCAEDNSLTSAQLSTDNSTVSQAGEKAAPAPSEMRLEGRLGATASGAKASGKATWEERSSRRKFSTEVEDVSSKGKHAVNVNGKTIGYVNVTAGFGDLNLDSRFGHKVPVLKSGDIVEVLNPDGVLILSGTMRPR
ncbi:MAG: hypothetical protein ACKVRP_08470 [Bacteroidota bacterium]